MSEERTAPPRLAWPEEQRLLGVGVRVQRRSSAHARHLPVIEAHAAALRDPTAAIVAARLAALRARLWRSPGWVVRLARHGFSPDDLRELGDLRHLPVLERDDYVADWQNLYDADGDPELTVATSSGSTGQPLLVPRGGYDGVHFWAVLRHWISTLGVRLPPRPRLVLVDALPGGLEYSVRAPQFFGGALHRVSTLRPGALRRIARVAPAVLSSDPAGLHWLLAQPALPAPRLVLSSAQHLAPPLRAAATAALGAPIVNYLATTETGPIAWECLREPGRFHTLFPDVWVESEAGRLDVTRLRDSPLPLLRWRTGDRGGVEDGGCACGARGRSIVGFAGREPCWFVTPSGARVDAWSLSWLFKDLPLVRFELAQVAPEGFALEVDRDLDVDLDRLVRRLEIVLRRVGFAAPHVAAARAPRPMLSKPRPFVPLVQAVIEAGRKLPASGALRSVEE
jgi:phenylacetate-CoA ligase